LYLIWTADVQLFAGERDDRIACSLVFPDKVSAKLSVGSDKKDFHYATIATAARMPG
jgi:hypothetical protein